MPELPFPLFLPSLGIGELSIVLVIILLLFGPGKLPSVMRALGDGVKQFKSASTKELDNTDGKSTGS